MAARKPAVIRFTGVVERMPGKGAWSFVEFPHDVEQLYGKRGAVRVQGTLNGVPMDRALMPSKSGVHLIIIGADLRRQAKVKAGDKVQVEVWRDADADVVKLPDELAETLDFMPAFKAAWKKLKPGMQRSLCHWIFTGKSTATRGKRVAELLRRAEEDEMPFGLRPIWRER
ncbi:MAG TPA: YdeI/OmpD-associated family protein [Flavobacteriales bacterium]|jgi:hypothetical protein|nr:YdeI/OmpD-associated family protein [Flavobacteriales bacterium]